MYAITEEHEGSFHLGRQCQILARVAPHAYHHSKNMIGLHRKAIAQTSAYAQAALKSIDSRQASLLLFRLGLCFAVRLAILIFFTQEPRSRHYVAMRLFNIFLRLVDDGWDF